MPKLKTKSGAKKRFKFTATGKIKHGQARQAPRHDQASNEQIRTPAGHHGALRLRNPARQALDAVRLRRDTRCHEHPAQSRPRSPQKSLEAGQGLLRPPQEHHHARPTPPSTLGSTPMSAAS